MSTIRTKMLGANQIVGASSGTLVLAPAGHHQKIRRIRIFVQGTPASVTMTLLRAGVSGTQIVRLIAPAANTLHDFPCDDVLEAGDSLSFGYGAGGTVSAWVSGTEYED